MDPMFGTLSSRVSGPFVASAPNKVRVQAVGRVAWLPCPRGLSASAMHVAKRTTGSTLTAQRAAYTQMQTNGYPVKLETSSRMLWRAGRGAQSSAKPWLAPICRRWGFFCGNCHGPNGVAQFMLPTALRVNARQRELTNQGGD